MENKAFSLVLLDLNLPDADGLEILKTIQTKDNHPEVIIITGRDDLESAVRAVNLGAFSYLRKSIRPDELLTLVKRALEKREYLERLHKSIERYTLAVRGTNDGIWDRNLQTGKTYFSPRWKAIIGYKDDEIPNRYQEWVKRIHPDDKQKVLQLLEDYLDKKSPHYEAEFRLRHKDRSYRWILARGQVLWDKDEKPYRISGSHVDITSRKQMEQQLRNSEEMYRTLVETSPDPIIAIDLKGRITHTSMSMLNLYGGDQGLIGQRAVKLVAPEDRREIITMIRDLVETQQRKLIEYHLVNSDGKRCLVEMSMSVVHGKQGEILSFIGVLRDISRRKRLEEEVRIRHEAIESSIGAIVLADINGLIMEANWSFLNLFGYDQEKEAVGKKIQDLWIPRIPEDKIIQNVYGGGMWRGELWAINKQGNEFLVNASISMIIDSNHEPIGIVGFFNDITERKKTEEKLREASKMAALGEFVTGTAHEINNPIGIISGNAQYLLSKFDTKSIKKVGKRELKKIRESLEMINKHSLRCGEITRKLLAFGRSGQETTMAPVKLNSVLNEVISILGHQLELSDITIDKHLGHLPQIEANASQLNQVFMNLILNAAQAMPKGGRLTIKSGHRGDNLVRAEVIDKGGGIPAEIQNHVFDPFFTTRRPGEGTGLGLSVTYSIIKAHQGDIQIESKSGQGTKVVVELPLKQESLPTVAKPKFSIEA